MIMKKKIMYISCMALSLGLISCNDDFLEVYPRDTQTEVTAFVTAENFETYAWGLYSIFGGYNDFIRYSADTMTIRWARTRTAAT